MTALIKLTECIVIALMAVVTASVMAEVLMRGVFGTSLIVTEELSRYLMIWVAMLAMALVAGADGHIRITLVADMLSPPVARVMNMVADIFVLIFLAAFIVTSLRHLPSMTGQGTVTLGVNMAWIYASMPVGGALAVVLILHRNVARVREMLSAASRNRES